MARQIDTPKTIPAGTARLVVQSHLAKLRPVLVGRIADLLDPANTIRKRQKLQNMALVMRYDDETIINAHNLVVMLNGERWAKAKKWLQAAQQVGVSVWQFYKNNK
jgi:hypothetical protein